MAVRINNNTNIRGSVSGVVSDGNQSNSLSEQNTTAQSSGNNPEEVLRDGIAGNSGSPVNVNANSSGSVENDESSLRDNPIDNNDVESEDSALTEGVAPGEPRDGTDEEDLRPVITDTDVRKLYTVRGAVTSVILDTDGTYNNEVYQILLQLNDDDILPHVSITDKNISGEYRLVVTNAIKDGDTIKFWYQEQNGITGNTNLYCVTISSDGTYIKESNNIDNGFYRVGSDGFLWTWDPLTKQYISTGERYVAAGYHIEVYTANGGQLMRTGSECDVFAEVWDNDRNITSSVPSAAFSWQRSSGYEREDYIWNARHEGAGETIHLSVAEIMGSCTIYCLVPVSVLQNLNI